MAHGKAIANTWLEAAPGPGCNLLANCSPVEEVCARHFLTLLSSPWGTGKRPGSWVSDGVIAGSRFECPTAVCPAQAYVALDIELGTLVGAVCHPSKIWSFVESTMETPAQRMLALKASQEYAQAQASYSNAFANGAGRQKPGTVGFALWLLYDIYCATNNRLPTSEEVVAMADAHGLNRTSARNARLKWGAYRGFLPPRTGEYAEGPRS